MPATTVTTDLSVYTSGLTGLQKYLKAVADGTDKRLRVGLKAAGNIAAQRARENAAWSSTIPKSIKVSVTQKQVAITAGGKNAPDAISYEVHGKHPVWSSNRKRWNKVPLKRPFLRPAAIETAPKVAQAICQAVADIGSREFT
jgi:Bacteriophage HK97-gp10, putative tail-component